MKALITGASGFAAQHLARRLSSAGIEVHAASRRESIANSDSSVATWHRYEITDLESIYNLIRSIRPDQLYHLAAVTSEQDILQNPIQAFDVNVVGTEQLLRVVSEIVPDCSVLLTGSSAEYGLAQEKDNPINEQIPLRPVTLYGISKVAQMQVGMRYFLTKGLRVIGTRAFNYAGPGQSDKFVISAICRKIAEIEQQQTDFSLKTGNLESHRDFTDVRDVTEAYVAALTHGQAGQIYNIASGRAEQIRMVVQKLIDLSDCPIQLDAPPPESATKSDVPIQVGDAACLNKQTGWKPQISLDETLRDTLNYWRNKVRTSTGVT